MKKRFLKVFVLAAAMMLALGLCACSGGESYDNLTAEENDALAAANFENIDYDISTYDQMKNFFDNEAFTSNGKVVKITGTYDSLFEDDHTIFVSNGEGSSYGLDFVVAGLEDYPEIDAPIEITGVSYIDDIGVIKILVLEENFIVK